MAALEARDGWHLTRFRAPLEAGLWVEYRALGESEHRSKYDRPTLTILINLDHPAVRNALNAAKGSTDDLSFRLLSFELAFTEYSLALGVEMANRRMNIRKQTLREWRRQFASHRRAQGIAANATERAARGVTRPQKPDGIYWAMRAGRSSHLRVCLESVASGLRTGNLQVEPGKRRMLDTRREVLGRWSEVQDALHAEGQVGLAIEVERFMAGMPPPRTEHEWLALTLIERIRAPKERQPVAQTR